LKVLVVGHGAREHAIAKKLAEADVEMHAAMGRRNPGIAGLSERVEIMAITDPEAYSRFQGVDIAFIGPEAPLSTGVSDKLRGMVVPVVGPSHATARLEWSKSYARIFLDEQEIEGNPEFSVCRSRSDIGGFLDEHPSVAVKPDVLTGGKGVKISGEHLNGTSEVEEYALQCIANDGLVVLEERLVGREFTLQAFTDGSRVEVMPLVRDFKRAYDGDTGPNTGSMGSYSCAHHGLPDLSDESVAKGVRIMNETITRLRDSVEPYMGFLYGGFMETEDGVYLIEYNSRLGDPEAMNVLALLEGSLLDIGWQIVEGRLGKPAFERQATVCVYLVPRGYPVNPVRDSPVTIQMPKNSQLYYASVHEEAGVVRTTGSRSVALLAKGGSVDEARTKVYGDIPSIRGDLFYRKDIGAGV
jgi:phosphoribosylamine--glycine ligase